MLFYLLGFACILAITWLIYRENVNKHRCESNGIFFKGTIRGIVALFWTIAKGSHFIDVLNKDYDDAKTLNTKIMGGNDFGTFSLTIYDPDLIKAIFVKDFDHFVDRREFATGKQDYLFRKMLFALQGERWKLLRSKLSPIFTTGKIKRVFQLFELSSKKFVRYLESEIADSSVDGEIDISRAYSKFSMDIIASAACGIDSEAFNQKEPSLFENMGKKLQFKFTTKDLAKFMLMSIIPARLNDFLGLSVFEKDMQDFFSTAIKESIKQRTEKNQRRDDFIQLMLEARQGILKTDESELEAFEKAAIVQNVGNTKKVSSNAEILDDEGIVANSVLFILAGFDTTQSLLLFCSYALAIYPEIQRKVRDEVDSIMEESNGRITYDGLNRMTYLDMVINETLRMWPPAPVVDRGCVADYRIPGTDFVVKKGEGVIVPIYNLHHDPKYFPEPEKFIPERFSPDNKPKISPYLYLPFGQGPRNCIGMRFALAEVKAVISSLVHEFFIEPSPKTLVPMEFSKNSTLKPKGDSLYISLKKIKH